MKARQSAVWGWLVSLGLACALVLLWPTLDLWVATRFYDPQGIFPAGQIPLVQGVYVWAPRVGWMFTAAALAVILIRWVKPERVSLGLWRQCVAWCLVAVLGNGLVVHELLKNQVGRPRPNQVQEMGGQVPFVPAMQLSVSCSRNCSFVSGHAALGFAVLSLGMWSAPAVRRRWWLLGLLTGSAIGFVRMVQGGHFLSDVLFSFLAIWGSSLAVRYVWLRCRLWQRQRRT